MDEFINKFYDAKNTMLYKETDQS